MNSNQTLTLSNIQAQSKDLLGVWVQLKFDDEDIDYYFGTAVVFNHGGYSPEIVRFYGEEIEEVDEQDLVKAYAIAFGSISAKLISFNDEEDTTYTFLSEVEGVIELKPDTWYEQASQRKGVKVDIPGMFDLVSVNGASAWFFKPNQKAKIKVSKELVWGVQSDDDWDCFSSWQRDDKIDPNYSETVDTTNHYAKQSLIWKAEIIS
jgi:hypothetical protein